MQTMVDTIIFKFKKRITSTDKKFVRDAVFRLIHLEKANLVRHRGAKRNIDVSHTDATAKVKRSKSDTESAKKVRFIMKYSPLPKFGSGPVSILEGHFRLKFIDQTFGSLSAVLAFAYGRERRSRPRTRNH